MQLWKAAKTTETGLCNTTHVNNPHVLLLESIFWMLLAFIVQSVWWEDKDVTGWHRLHYGPQWPTRTCWVPPQLSPLSGEIFAHGPLHLQLSVPCWGPVKETATSKSTYDCYNVHLRQQFSTQDVYFKRAKYLQNIVLSKSFRQTHQAHFVALLELDSTKVILYKKQGFV